jgi:hypothetical protein
MAKHLNKVTDEELLEVTKLASLFLTPRQIGIMLELDVLQFIAACDFENSRFYQAFHSGRLQSEVDLRTSIMKLAKSGSSPAQKEALHMLNESKIKMIDR